MFDSVHTNGLIEVYGEMPWESLPKSPVINDPRLDGITILIVDDDADSRAVLEWFLTSHGANVLPARSASQALRIIDTQSPDLLLSDISMPDADGYELLAQIRALEKAKNLSEKKSLPLPAAAISAFATAADRQKSLRAGFQFHITKPMDFIELMASVAALAGRVQLS